MTAELIAIEGIDGSGKGTLAANLADSLTSMGFRVSILRHPRYQDGPFGRLIADFLNGNGFGFDDHPYAVSALYALDRRDGLPDLQQMRADNDVVILDRYIASNIAYQCARIAPRPDAMNEQARALQDWIIDYETNRLGLPIPALTFFLKSNAALSARLVAAKGERAYTQLVHDRNESDGSLLDGAARWYVYLGETEERLGPWQGIDITQTTGELRNREEIASEAVTSVVKILKKTDS